MLTSGQMKKSDLVREMTRQNGGDAESAAEQVEHAVNRIILALRRGKSARLPGLGTISPGKKWTFRPERHDS